MREITDNELAAVTGAGPCGYAEFLLHSNCISGCSSLMLLDDGGEAYFLCTIECNRSIGCDG
jgi:hypothetical protein